MEKQTREDKLQWHNSYDKQWEALRSIFWYGQLIFHAEFYEFSAYHRHFIDAFQWGKCLTEKNGFK